MSNNTSDPLAICYSTRVYEWLLALYPAAHRLDYGPMMVQLFRDQCRDAFDREGRWGLFKTWLSAVLDLGKSACVEHVLTMKRKLNMTNKPLFTLNRRRLIAAVFLLISSASIAVTLWLPRYFASTARIAVEKDAPLGQAAPSAFANNANVYDPYFIQTEFERLQSKELIYRVIEELGLVKRWDQQMQMQGGLNKQEAFTLLRKRLDIRPFRNTSLVEIRVLSGDKNEAAEIANKIADVYQNMRVDQMRIASMKGIDALQHELAQQEKKIAEAQARLEDMRAKGNGPEMLADSGQAGQAAAELLPRFRSQMMDADIAYRQMTTLCKTLNGLTRAELRNVLPTVSPDAQLTELLSRCAQTEQELVTLQKEYADSHPSVVNVKQLLAKINEQVDSKTSGILAGLKIKAQSQENELELRQAALDKTIKENSDNAKMSNAYQMANHDLDFQKQIRQTIMLRLQQERLDANMPKTSPVVFVDRAEPGLRPIRPNYFANIATGVFIAMLASAALAVGFFLKGLMTKTSQTGAA